MSSKKKKIAEKRNFSDNQPQSKSFVNSDELFSKIQQFRETLMLSKLSYNKTLEIVAHKLIQTEKMAPIDEKDMDYVLVSIYSFLDSFSNENIDQIITRWIGDCSKRPIIISHGNYGTIKIQYDDETKSSGKIAMIVALIYRPK